jgi:hypothetical protein
LPSSDLCLDAWIHDRINTQHKAQPQPAINDIQYQMHSTQAKNKRKAADRLESASDATAVYAVAALTDNNNVNAVQFCLIWFTEFDYFEWLQ